MNKNLYLTPIPWEEKALAIPCFQVSDHGIHHLDETCRNITTQYENKPIFVQLKLPAHLNKHASWQTRGFILVEVCQTLTTHLKNNASLSKFNHDPRSALPAYYQHNNHCVVEIIDKKNHKHIETLQTIAMDSIRCDRFHQDVHCPAELAAIRYRNWITDLASDPESTLLGVFASKVLVGFNAIKANQLLLIGLSTNAPAQGLGGFITLSSLQYLQECGYQTAKTAVSAINTSSLNLYTRLGFVFRAPTYVYHYWRTHSYNDA